METKELLVHEGNDEGVGAERQEQMCLCVFQQLPFFFDFCFCHGLLLLAPLKVVRLKKLLRKKNELTS